MHHKKGITNWQKIIDLIREDMLCDIDRLEVLCVECHKKEHKCN